MAREKALVDLARQQALAERLASTTEELLAGLEETSAAAGSSLILRITWLLTVRKWVKAAIICEMLRSRLMVVLWNY